jgi:urease accessory protein
MHIQSFSDVRSKIIISSLIAISSLALCLPAMAHHPFGGDSPTNAMEGFLSGLGHPVIGLDHLAFVITIGLLAAIFNRGLFIPVTFVLASLLGTGIHLSNVELPAPEFFIASSVLVFGLLLAVKTSLPTGAMVLLTGMAGMFHGYAYGEAVVGVEMSSLIAYLVGFSAIQTAISISAYLLAKKLGASSDAKPLNLRFAGFTLAGIGVAFLSATVLG